MNSSNEDECKAQIKPLKDKTNSFNDLCLMVASVTNILTLIVVIFLGLFLLIKKRLRWF